MAYLDHAATTPMSEAAIAATDAAFRVLGNASSLHTSGRNARRLVEEAREQIARALGALPGEVVFTSGGTEANNLAIKGLYWTRRAEDARRTRVITLPIEHHAVLDAVVEGLHVSEAEILCLAKDKNLQKKYKSLNYDLVREAFPDLLPVKVKEEKSVPLS